MGIVLFGSVTPGGWGNHCHGLSSMAVRLVKILRQCFAKVLSFSAGTPSTSGRCTGLNPAGGVASIELRNVIDNIHAAGLCRHRGSGVLSITRSHGRCW